MAMELEIICIAQDIFIIIDSRVLWESLEERFLEFLVKKHCNVWTVTFPPGDQINVESIVEEDQQHPLVGQEDEPLPAQSLQIMEYMSQGE